MAQFLDDSFDSTGLKERLSKILEHEKPQFQTELLPLRPVDLKKLLSLFDVNLANGFEIDLSSEEKAYLPFKL